MTARLRQLCLVLLLPSACAGSPATPPGRADGPPPLAPAQPAMDGPGPTSPDAGAAAPADAGHDPSDAHRDEGADAAGGDARTGADQLASYLKFLSDHQSRLEARLVECLHKDQRLLDLYRAPLRNEATDSLRLGLVTFDNAVAASCLDRVRGASCDEILEMFEHRLWTRPEFPGAPPCRGVLIGRVAEGQSCLSPADCRSPGLKCTPYGSSCGSKCLAVHETPPAEIGARCLNGCVAGAVCKYVSIYNSVCVARTEEGGDCIRDEFCADHLHCAPKAPDQPEGQCRRIGGGGTCRGTWQCPYGLACVGASKERDGTCQAGKLPGEACAVQGGSASSFAFSDCADGGVCLDLDGGARCWSGVPLGGRCGSFLQPFQSSNDLPCLEGYCDRSAGQREGICRPRKAAGSACSNGAECDTTARCVPGSDGKPICKPVSAFGAGDPCTGRDGDLACPAGTACRPDHAFSYNLTCQPIKKVGESCENLDHCEPLAACKAGVCTPC